MDILLSSSPSAETMGFDIEACEPRCSLKAGIFDLYATKVNALRLAVDAAITVLR
jgi:chaperonin GroEL (HSP60 family)